MNYFKTTFLMALLTSLFVGLGFLIGGQAGMILAFLMALVMNFLAYWHSDQMVLKIYKAQPIDQHELSWLYTMVQQLAVQANLPIPQLYLIHNPQPNAFATGRNPVHAAIAVTTGLIQELSREEVTGVIAHEMAHIKNRDTLTMTITATLAGAISMLANMAFFFGGRDRNSNVFVTLLVALLAPLAAMLVQMAISRSREYEADRVGSLISGDPLKLASALKKIDNFSKKTQNVIVDTHPATAHMFIINPLKAQSLKTLFSTHPHTEDRIKKLMDMANSNTTLAASYSKGPWD
ncbi:MAG: zinc metalloprotease HtpX [Alphaproteobacteria bacterium]|nr:zinc metalloprotease HtpX [Alphaproteobacteria bacterium]